jgi:hypothetical protein
MIKEHDAICPLGIHECPTNNVSGDTCNWRGQWKDFETHLFDVHKKKVNKSPYNSSSINESWEFMLTRGKLFLFHKNKYKEEEEEEGENHGADDGGDGDDDDDDEMWHCNVMLIGTHTEAAEYKTIFTLSAENEVDSNVYTRRVSSFIEKLDDVNSYFKRFSISNSIMKNFIIGGRMNLKVEVTEINNFQGL